MSPKQAQSTFNLHFKNGILWRRCKSCVIAYWLGSTEPIWSIMIISVGLQFFSVFSWAKYKSTTGAIMIKNSSSVFTGRLHIFRSYFWRKRELNQSYFGAVLIIFIFSLICWFIHYRLQNMLNPLIFCILRIKYY